jgi:hypothetical protein
MVIPSKRPFDAARLRLNTQVAKRRVDHIIDFARALQADPKRAQRLTQQRCIACYYAPPVVAGAAITTQPCACCGTPEQYASTSTDYLCAPCAQQHDLCKHCGADIDIDTTRSQWPDAAPKEE